MRGNKAIWGHRLAAAMRLGAMVQHATPRRTVREVRRVVNRCPVRGDNPPTLLVALAAALGAAELAAELGPLAVAELAAAAADKGKTMTDSRMTGINIRASWFSPLASVCVRFALLLALSLPLVGLAAGQKT